MKIHTYNFRICPKAGGIGLIILLMFSSCAPTLINVPDSPLVTPRRVEFSSIDLYITNFDVQRQSNRDVAQDNTGTLLNQLISYINSQNAFRQVQVVSTGFKPRTENYMTLSVQIIPNFTKHRNILHDILFFYPGCCFMWPWNPQWGVVTVDFKAVLAGSKDHLPRTYQVKKEKNYNMVYYSWYRSRPIEDAFRSCYQQAFNEFNLYMDSMEDEILASAGISSKSAETKTEYVPPAAVVDVDQYMPDTKVWNPDAIAVVIGNCNYKNAKKVDFALNDARILKQYLIRSFGYREGNIFLIEDATKADFELFFGIKDNYRAKLYNTVRKNESDVFIYYSGHGAPDVATRRGYFVPVDCDPQYVQINGYPLDVFYANLSQIPARSVTVVLDACFSGAELFENISPLIPVIENPIIANEDAIVLCSSSGTQVSSWYPEKRHGLFTYFFLKAIHDRLGDSNRDGNLTFEEIHRYVSDDTEGVPYYARLLHGVEQKPTLVGRNTDKVMIDISTSRQESPN